MLKQKKKNLRNSCWVSSRTPRSLIKKANAKYSESKESANSRTLRLTSKKLTENQSQNERNQMDEVFSSFSDKTS